MATSTTAGAIRCWIAARRDRNGVVGAAMKQVRTGIDIDAAVTEVWPLLAEFRHWPEWGPSIRAVESAAEQVAPGVTGRVQTLIGVWVPFEITSAIPERSWDWKVAGLKATGHSLADIGRSVCRVEFTVAWPLMPYLVVMRRGLHRLKALAERAR